MGLGFARAHSSVPWPSETLARSRGLIGFLSGENDPSVGSDPVCEPNQTLNLNFSKMKGDGMQAAPHRQLVDGT
jgi:hypothetical protein